MVRPEQLFEFDFQFYSISVIGNDLLVRVARNSDWYANICVAKQRILNLHRQGYVSMKSMTPIKERKPKTRVLAY